MNGGNSIGQTPIFFVREGDDEMLELLLKNGAQINARY